MTVPRTITVRGKEAIRRPEMKAWVAQGQGPQETGVAAGTRARSHSSCGPGRNE